MMVFIKENQSIGCAGRRIKNLFEGFYRTLEGLRRNPRDAGGEGVHFVRNHTTTNKARSITTQCRISCFDEIVVRQGVSPWASCIPAPRSCVTTLGEGSRVACAPRSRSRTSSDVARTRGSSAGVASGRRRSAARSRHGDAACVRWWAVFIRRPFRSGLFESWRVRAHARGRRAERSGAPRDGSEYTEVAPKMQGPEVSLLKRFRKVKKQKSPMKPRFSGVPGRCRT